MVSGLVSGAVLWWPSLVGGGHLLVTHHRAYNPQIARFAWVVSASGDLDWRELIVCWISPIRRGSRVGEILPTIRSA